jgi:F-type H+-transporting ATPase subunit beta
MGAGEVLETGVKVIDLLCPYRKGGKAAILGPMGVGKLVGIEEVVHNVASRGDGLSLFTFFRPGNEASLIQEDIRQGPVAGTVQTILLAADDPQDPVPTADAFDAITYMTRDLAARGLYPAVDPLRSTSRLLDPSIVGAEHFDVARRVRETLRHAKELESTGADLSEEEKLVVSRAHKIEIFFTQPFFVAEPYTGRAGQYVSREETVKAFGAILAGAYDDLPEEAFQWCGTIEQAIEKAKDERQ